MLNPGRQKRKKKTYKKVEKIKISRYGQSEGEFNLFCDISQRKGVSYF